MLRDRIKMLKPDMMAVEQTRDWQEIVEVSDHCLEYFLTLSDQPELKSADIYMGGIADMTKHYTIERKGGDLHTLLCTVSGEGVLTTNDNVYTVPNNHMMILPAGKPYRFELGVNNSNWRFVWFVMPQTKRWGKICANEQRVVPFPASEQVWALCTLLHHEANGRSSMRSLYVSEIEQLLTHSPYTIANSELRVETQFNRIRSQIHHSWTVSEIAKACFISEEQLGRICRKRYNCSPKKKLIDMKMSRAKDFLTINEETLGSIASRVGYADAYSFSQSFKRYYGLSPKAYIKSLNHQVES